MPRVLVTRPAPAAQAWVRELAAQGVDAVALPLIEIALAPMAGDLLAARQRLGEYQVAMFVSGNAVRGFLRSGLVPAPADVETRAWSPGPGTTAALQDAGWPADRIDAPAHDAAQFDSESLWEQVARQVEPGCRVLIVRGANVAGQLAGRPWLADQLGAAGASLRQVLAYRRCVPAFNESQQSWARAAAGGGFLWLLSSSESVANLKHNLPGVDWGEARALATHPRIAAAARAAGFGRVQESRPTLADVVASIKSLS